MVDICLVEEELGKTSDALIRRIFGQVYPMLMACQGEQRERYLIPTVKGDLICAMAITEPGAGSDAAAISTTARMEGNHWVINGTKHFISDGDIADYTIVMALTDKEKRARGGITLLLVDKGTPGFTVRAPSADDGPPRLRPRGACVRELPRTCRPRARRGRRAVSS